jgi:beta-glucanase (GH16 family)
VVAARHILGLATWTASALATGAGLGSGCGGDSGSSAADGSTIDSVAPEAGAGDAAASEGGDSAADGAARDAGADACTDDVCDTLVWSDEFDGSGLPDPNDWGYEQGFVRNNEAQYYTVARTQNCRQENGSLVIEAIHESYMGASYTSCSINTKGKVDFLDGRLEVRAKLPTGRGTWPAAWLLGTNIDVVGWPSCGEIDVMENVGFMPNTIFCTLHYEGDAGPAAKGSQIDLTNPTPFADFHVYAMDWTQQRIVLSVDGTPVETYVNDGVNPWPFGGKEYVLLNLAIGGNWGGQQGIDDSIFPVEYLVDYVRYYRHGP